MFTDERTLVFSFPDLLSVYSHPVSYGVSCLTNLNFFSPFHYVVTIKFVKLNHGKMAFIANI